MAAKRNPEQRSTSGRPAPGASAAIPTGEEVYNTNQAETGAGGAAPAEEAAPETGTNVEENLAHLQSLAVEYYEKLGEIAEDLTEQASRIYASGQGYVRSHPGSTVLGAFALGVLIGVLSGRR